MSHQEAINILDMRRAGADMPQAVVDKALELTGDKEPEFCVADAMLELVLDAK